MSENNHFAEAMMEVETYGAGPQAGTEGGTMVGGYQAQWDHYLPRMDSEGL